MASRSPFGNIRRRDDIGGKWQARWQDVDGHSHSKTFSRQREATAWLASQTTDRHRGEWTDPRDGHVRFDTWQASWRSTVVNLRPSTRVRDFGYIDRYLLPAFGRLRLDEIDAVVVETWIAELSQRLAPATVVKAAQIMRKIMASAVRAKRLPASPMTGVAMPKIERDEMRFLEVEQAWALADAIDERYRGLVVLGFGCGLRPGELLGLRVGKVNYLQRRVDVAEVVVEADGHLYVGPPKTRAGRRAVPMPTFVSDALRAHTDGRHVDELVFPAPSGSGHVRLASWRQRFWRPALDRAGVAPGLRVHDLRHTAVAWWIAAGAQPVDIARRAGHTSVSTVLDRYGHLMAGTESAVTDRLDLFGAQPNPLGRVVPIR